MSLPPDTRRTRTVTLPSGKTVVVNYVEAKPDVARPGTDPEYHLEVCGSCGSHLVHPVHWEPAGSRYWQIELRCPECEWGGTGVFDQDAVDRFDAVLERATEDLVSDLKAVERANMVAFGDRFLAALGADQVWPEDF